MSRPWQFSEDGARSPFDRPAPNASAQPPSFQINVNRQKSKKWTEAKNYNYDGDDWGGYDEYNEYGTYDDDEDGTESEPAPLPSAAVLKHRSNSFDRGDEQRSFSAGAPITPQKHANAPSQSTSSTGRASQGPYEIRRDFTQPAHVPPPLNFRASRDASPAPPPVPNITNAGSPSGATHPPRKSSLSGSIPTDLYSSPTAKPASSGTTTGTSLPFIRPADIYKRMQAEKEKDKERQPSLGPLTDGSESMNASHQYGRPGFTVDNPVLARAIGANVAADPAEGSSTPSAPEVASPQATQRSLQHQPSLGFHSVVHEAFDRHDDTHIPLTPISRDNSSSQNGSDTSGISPIMSHVPSTAAAEFRARAREASVPPIAEESSLPESPDLGQSQVVQRKPSPAQSQTHSRTTSGEGLPVSYTPGYRRSLDPPSQESTPVRTPELEFTKRLSHPMAAETALHLPREDTDPVKPLPADYSKRESDLAEEASSSPDKSVFSVAAASHVARANFLQAHSPTLSTSPTFSRPASRSPSPGRQSPGGASRVQQLAGKFDNMHALSRTSSGLSIRSKSSVQSWERSEENLPLKRTGTFESGKSDKDELGLPEYDNADIKGLLTPARPEPTSVPSFRPHLPGEWVSYIDTPRNSKIAVESEVTPRETEEFTATDPSSAASSGAPRPTSTSPATDPVDLAPTTAKQKLHERDISERESSSIDAVKAAGEALGTALMSSMGLGGGHQTRDFAEPEKFLSPEAPSAAPEQNRPSVRDVYLCPLAIDEAASSVGSSVAPTPLPKDTPEGRGMQRSSGYFPAPVLRVGSDDHNLDSPEDMESDRLRKEIERSLSPQTLMNTEKHDQIKRDQDALDGPANLRDHQEAEQLPPATTPDLSMPSLSVAPAEFAPGGIPTLLNKRFSWEKRAETSEPLFAPEGAEPTEPRAPYERPISNQGLHIVNANISADSSAATTPVLQEPSNTLQGSIITSQPVELEAAGLAPHQGLQSTDDTSDVSAIPSPSFDHQPSQEDSVAEPPLERPIVERSGTGSGSSIPTVTASAGGDTTRIPPFREILALKSSPERISKYNETRTQFAATDTGLSNWLSSTLASNPEHADLTASISSSGSGGSNVIGSTRQKPAAKIMQNARNLLPLRENASADTETAGSGGPQRKVSVGQSGAFQAKGKDFMKSAGVFGGKASVGAKGLFAKAKGKLREGGNEKTISNDRNKIGRQTTETIQRPPLRSVPPGPVTPSRSVISPASEESRPVISGISQAANPENTINEGNQQPAPMVGTRNVPRAPSRTSNRLSTVFGRLRDGPQNRPKSQTSSTILSPFDKDPVAVDGDIQRLPVMMSPTETDVAPWTVPDEVGIKTPNMHRIGLNGRIGFLPSPAVETQMTLEQQDETEHGAVMQEVQQEAKQESQQDIQQKSQLDIQPEDAPEHNQSEVDARDSANSSTATRVGQGEAIKAINKSTIAVETSEARLSADSHRVSYCSEPSLQQHDEQSRFSEPTMVEPPTATDPLQPIVKPMGSVLRSPAARPSRFSDAYYLIDTKNLATEPTFSPVSSLGPDAEDEIDNRKKEDGNYLDGMVSPVDEGEIQPMEKPVVSVPANVEEEAREHHNTSHDQQPYTELNSVAPQQRPITERKMSRSSLPSQQRPVESPKRINWNPPRSRRASQVLEPATEGVVTPHFGSRKNSINGLGDFQINSGSYFTSDDISAATASNLSSDFQGPVDGTSGMSSSSWGQRVGQASPLPMEDTARGPWPNPQQHYGCLQQPASVNDLPPQEFTSQHYTYAQQPVTAGAPPPVRREDLQSNRFTPATFDPKQQSAEHSYVGEQSPPQNRLYRRTYPGANCNSGPQSQAESKFSVDAARTNPSTVTNQQQPFASDKMSQATLQEQKEKRRSGFFGAFSRSSSVSESSRLSSRGNTTATAADTSASKQPPQSQGYANPAISASQEARENTDSRDNILNKLGRSATTASMQDPEKKEKRFSRLGSIFGRRNSKAGRPPPVVKPQPPPEAKKPNRLVKPMPISHSQSQSRKSASSTPVQRSRESLPIRSTTRPTGQGDVLSPQSPPPGLQAMYQYQSGCQPGAAELTQLPAAWSAPPPGGWYAPSGRPSSYTESERQQGKKREPTLPVVQPTGAGYSSPQQTTRRLHSEGFRREPRYMTASPGPGSVTNNAAAPRERYYASGGQAIPPGTVMADRVDTGWEQTMPPMIASHLATSGSAPRDIQRTNGQRRLSGSWQHQSSYGSDAGGAGPHLDNFSLYGTSPNSRRHGSIGSDARMPNLTPTHSRTASFGAAPKDVYRMSSTFEGEQTLQRNFEQIIMQAQEGVMYGPNGGNCAYATDPSVNDGRTSANSSPYRSRGEAGGRYMQQQYLQRSNTSGAGVFLPMPPARTLSGNWQQFAAPGPGSPVGSLRQSRTPNESRAGSRTNSLVIIDEDHPFPDQSHAPSAPPISATSAPAPVSIPASSPAQNVKTWGSQQGYASRQPPPQIQSFSPGGRSYNRMWSPQQTQSQQQQQQQQPPTPQSQYMNYNANFERRRAERRGSGAYTQHAREQHTVEQVGEPTQMENPNHSGHL